MPNALAIGVPYELFWHLTPKKLESFSIAYKLRQRMDDERDWKLGLYFCNAAFVATANAIAAAFGKKGNAEYLKEPFLLNVSDEADDERELERMILYEEQWAMNDKMRGLPETKIL